MEKDKKITFKRCSVMQDILEGMEGSKQAMIKEGLWHDRISFEEWSNYAGSHCLITEKATNEPN